MDQVDVLAYSGIKAMHDRYLRLSVTQPMAYVDESLLVQQAGSNVVRADVDSRFVNLRLGDETVAIDFDDEA